MNMKIIAGVFTLAALAFGHAAQATQINLVTNGNFDQSSYTTNNQFGTGYGGQGVTGWTGGNGYQLYFVNGTATVNSANSQYDSGYNTGSEKFYTMPGSPTGGTGNFVALDGDQTSGIQGSISQTISGLTIGASYTVTFDWATGQLQSRSGATTDNVNVSFGNQSITTQTISDASQGSTPWLQQPFLYTATSATETLTFLAQGTPDRPAADGRPGWHLRRPDARAGIDRDHGDRLGLARLLLPPAPPGGLRGDPTPSSALPSGPAACSAGR